ncbi:hypothetical protein CHS0354_031563 [Potamilus streckersoni]|uniref:Uncharacterized protein n=1 Tax=Potamilus streckersoni TaxID=2493646 RepID=A0AAE0SYR5_9BIVA|nr:hypothetical protein CHS0354_031563 [Potamilus streckersoni]
MAYNQNKIKFGVELVDATLRHLVFLKEINKNTIVNRVDVLERAIYRYEHFWLPLAAENPNETLVAPLDIHWVWHCHMLCPKTYVKDCMNIVGVVVDHAFVEDRSKALQRSQSLWYPKYQERHESFELDLHTLPTQLKPITKKSRLSYNIKQAASRQGAFYYQVSLPHYRDKKFIENGLLRYKKFIFLKQQNPGEFLVPCYDIDLIWHTHQLHPHIYKRDMETIIGQLFNHDDTVTDRRPGSKLSTADLKTRDLWKKAFNESFSMYGAMYRGTAPQGKLNILEQMDVQASSTWKTRLISFWNCIKFPINRLNASFILQRGRYERAVIPENVEQVWGPIPFSHLYPGTSNPCQVADHSLKSRTGQMIFTCRIIHSLPLLMSAIQVYHHDKTVAVAHTIGSDQLPLSTQVENQSSCMTLNPRANERAVLIKNARGDWGICLGKWTGFRKGIPGIKGPKNSIPGTPGSPGTLTINFLKIETGEWLKGELGYLRNKFKFNMESMEVDLKKGIIQVDTASNEVSENLALAFSVSLLHVLCVPRPANWKEGNTVATQVSFSRGDRAVNNVPSDNMELILACGLHESTPNNNYIRRQYGNYAGAGCVGGDGLGNFEDVSGNLSSPTDGLGDCGGCGGCGGCSGGCGGCGGCGG